MTDSYQGFFVAPYAPDGESLGVGFWNLSELSKRWLEVADQFLQANGNTFRASWGRELKDIETRLTSSNGAGLSTFYVEGNLVSSHLLLTGINLEGEQELMEMFLKSLLNVRLVQMVAQGTEPFGSVRELSQRPLEVVVIWAPAEVKDERIQIAQELARHFASAFFREQLQGGFGV